MRSESSLEQPPKEVPFVSAKCSCLDQDSSQSDGRGDMPTLARKRLHYAARPSNVHQQAPAKPLTEAHWLVDGLGDHDCHLSLFALIVAICKLPVQQQ